MLCAKELIRAIILTSYEDLRSKSPPPLKELCLSPVNKAFGSYRPQVNLHKSQYIFESYERQVLGNCQPS